MPSRQAATYTIETRVGRLIEARIFGLRTGDDANAYSAALGAHVLRMPRDPRPILCADHRPVTVYSQPVAQRLVELFTQMNTRLDRAAILAARTNATLSLQLERLVREAAFPNRKLFYTPSDVEAYLSPVLDPAELKQMRAFLDEYPARSPT
jgi:hypothetical protein